MKQVAVTVVVKIDDEGNAQTMVNAQNTTDHASMLRILGWGRDVILEKMLAVQTDQPAQEAPRIVLPNEIAIMPGNMRGN